MKKDSCFSTLLSLMLTFMKVGAFTFGGGYAMIPIIQNEICDKKHWINGEELLDILAISESTPGPIAVNTATFVGYRVKGFWGAFFATLGLIIPSFLIIYLISLIYQSLMEFSVVQAIFKGLRVGVIFLLVNAVLKLKKNMKFSVLNIIEFVFVLIVMFIVTIFNISIPGLTIILIATGLIIGLLSTIANRRKA